MGTGDDDPNGMKEVFALRSSSLFYFINNGFETFRREPIAACSDSSCKFSDDSLSNFRSQKGLIVIVLHRCFSVIVQQEPGPFG